MKIAVCLVFLLFVFSCKKDRVSEATTNTAPVENDTTPVPLPDNTYFNLPADSAPHFVNICYIDLNKVTRISRFRSGIGHDYSDDFEFCRSMKHYFDPGMFGNDTICIYAPVKGKVVRMFSEWAGSQIQIQSEAYPAFTFVIFHVNAKQEIQENADVLPGQLLGYHIGNMTMSDIAVKVNTSVNGPKSDSIGQAGLRLFSIFQVMSDSLFSVFQQRGIISRNEMIIPEDERNNAPLDCNGEIFNNEGTLQNWIVLQ